MESVQNVEPEQRGRKTTLRWEELTGDQFAAAVFQRVAIISPTRLRRHIACALRAIKADTEIRRLQDEFYAASTAPSVPYIRA